MDYNEWCGAKKISQSHYCNLQKQVGQPLRIRNDVCLVCGDVGYPEHLISCSRCKRNKEHRYCMKLISLSEEAELSWICKECMSLDDIPIGAIFPLKKKFANVKKDASRTMKNVNFDADTKKDNPRVVEKKTSFQEFIRRTTNDSQSNNEHDMSIPRETDDPMISGMLMKSEAEIKRRRKAVISDSSDDVMFTNDHPTRGHSCHEKANSEGSFNMWLDDATEAEAITSSCSDFSFDVKLVSHESNSCIDASGGTELSLVNNNVVLSDNALVNANEKTDEKNAMRRRASNDVCVETSLAKHKDHVSQSRTNGDGRKKLLDGNNFASSISNAVEDLSGKILREKPSLPSRGLYDARGRTTLVEPREDRTDNSNIPEKLSVAGRPSYDTRGTSTIKHEENRNNCDVSHGRTNGNVANNNEYVRRDDSIPMTLVEPREDRTDNSNSPVKLSVAGRPSYDTRGTSTIKHEENRNNCNVSHGRTNGDVANNNEHEKLSLAGRPSYDTRGTSTIKHRENRNNCDVSHGGTNGNVANKNEYVKMDDSRPVNEVTWSGYFYFGDSKYGALHAHLTTSSYHVGQVNEEAKKLNRILSLEKVPNRVAWPSRFYTSSSPTENDIALYFFPANKSDVSWYDTLVRELIEKDETYRAILDCSELLLFPSNLLPDYYQRFSGKRYLWGSFRPTQTCKSKPTNGNLPDCKNSNEPARIASKWKPFERNAVKITHASLTHQKKNETAHFSERRASQQNIGGTGIKPDGRAGKNLNSLKRIYGR